MLPGPSDSPRTRVLRFRPSRPKTHPAPTCGGNANPTPFRRPSGFSNPTGHTGADTRDAPGGRGPGPVRGVTRPGHSPDAPAASVAGCVADSPAALTALRTAPATAPETFSLKTLGMM